ncbi:MAG: single-stranded-DNA-specific exonuclease RecJ [Chloroflexota bacterium]
MNRYRWDLLPPIPDLRLVHTSGLPLLIVQLLYNRGIREPAAIQHFISGDSTLTHDPFLLSGMDRAVNRIYRALLSGENIVIYGDFDADGITATALLVEGLTALGGKATPYIPHRQNEGHGLSLTTLKTLRQQGASLVITVDTGITNVTEVAKAKRLGMDIIITDHHVPLEEIPDAAAVIDPKLADSGYPFRELSGAGVAFKLLQALLQTLGRPELADRALDLVAIGTIADLSPLVAENRYLVIEGLKRLNRHPRPGLLELVQQAGLKDASLNADKVSWTIAPCLNASGRLADATGGYRLLLAASPGEAREMAAWLLEMNTERQQMTAAAFAAAREQVLAKGIGPLLIASNDAFHLGISGLVASRLSEEFYRPSVVISTGKKVCHASCRSIPEFNIITALNECRELLTQYGGHAQAAGFSTATGNLPQLEERLTAIATESLAEMELRPHIEIDAQVRLSEIGGGTFPLTQQLAPFGRANPAPTFLSRDVPVTACRTMGNGADHLRFRFQQDGAAWDGVAFRRGDSFPRISDRLDIVYQIEVDSWGGSERLRLCLLDFANSGQAVPAATVN